MSFATDLSSDFTDVILDDFGIDTTVGGQTVKAVRNNKNLEIEYMEIGNKSVEYKFSLWYNTDDLTAAGVSTPAIHDEIIVDGITLLVASTSFDPLSQIVSCDMVEQYG